MKYNSNEVQMFYFFAYWDKNERPRREFVRECRERNISFTTVDCEDADGVEMSIKYGVKFCPQVLILKKGKVIERLKGAEVKDIELEMYNRFD